MFIIIIVYSDIYITHINNFIYMTCRNKELIQIISTLAIYS